MKKITVFVVCIYISCVCELKLIIIIINMIFSRREKFCFPQCESFCWRLRQSVIVNSGSVVEEIQKLANYVCDLSART